MGRDGLRRCLEADVKCYHCGTLAGRLRREDGTSGGLVAFASSAGGPEATVRTVAGLRCPRCRGPVYADEFETVVRYVPGALLLEPPRRGRPPKRKSA